MKEVRYPVRLTQLEAKRFKEIESLDIKRSHYVRGSIKALVDVIDECERLGYTIKDDHDLLDMVKLVHKHAVIAVASSYFKKYYEKLSAVVSKRIKEIQNNEIPFDYE